MIFGEAKYKDRPLARQIERFVHAQTWWSNKRSSIHFHTVEKVRGFSKIYWEEKIIDSGLIEIGDGGVWHVWKDPFLSTTFAFEREKIIKNPSLSSVPDHKTGNFCPDLSPEIGG